MIKRVFFVLPLLLFTIYVQAQFNLGFEHYDQVKVVHNGDTLDFPWAGGLNNPQFSSLDVNLDGINDIYAYERDGEVNRIFINDGEGNFVIDQKSHVHLPKFTGSFVLLRDYDGDGKQDIFCSSINGYGIDIYRNVSDSVLKFELVKEKAKYSRNNGGALFFYIPSNDLPAIYDFDGDGDLDILVQGQVDFTPFVLLYLENRSQELYNNNDSLEFRLVNPCWGRIREYVAQTGWTEYLCDTGYINVSQSGERHGGTTLTAVDLNGDGITDLITGDSYSEHLFTLFNTGGNVNAQVDLTLTDTNFPSYDEPAQVPTLPGAYLEDVDQDGLIDMLVAPNQLTASASFSLDTSINTNVDWYYRNNGTNSFPDYELHTKGFFSGQMVDVGFKSMPTFADLNGDGLDDLIIGNEGYISYGGTAAASLTLYLNVGTAEVPVYQLETKNLADVASLGFGMAHPAFADLDDDGDFDLLVGDEHGNLHYFKNTGVPTIYNFQLNEPMFAGIDVTLNAHPFFFDVNSDDVMDLVIGDYYGRFHYYENAGSPTEHDFSQNPTIEKMGNVQTFNTYGGEATPYVTRKLDSLGASLYIMIGSAQGTILVFGPITNLFSNFEVADSIVVDATFTSPTGVNLYGDFRDEIFIGQRSGGIYAMHRAQEIGVGAKKLAKQSRDIQVFPNPSNGLVTISWPDMYKGKTEVRLFNSLGAMLTYESFSGEQHTVTLDNSSLAPGVYTFQVRQIDDVYQTQWIKQ